MSGFAGVLLAGGATAAIVNPIPITVVDDNRIDPADSAASVTFATDGALTGIGNGTTVGPRWYDPATTGIGSSYWLRYTLNSGSAVNAGGLVAGTIYALSASRQIGYSQTVGGSRSGNLTVEIASDVGFTTVVSSVTFNMSVLVDI